MAEHKAEFPPEKTVFDLSEKGNLSDVNVSLEEEIEEKENSPIEAVRLGKSSLDVPEGEAERMYQKR